MADNEQQGPGGKPTSVSPPTACYLVFGCGFLLMRSLGFVVAHSYVV